MTSKKPVFVIVTSGSCGHCKTYKEKQRVELVNRIKSEGKVNLIEIDLPGSRVEIKPEYHPDLTRYIAFFPQFLLFTGESWDNKSGRLEGVSINGEMINDKIELINKPTKSDTNFILNWINLQSAEFRSKAMGSSQNPNSVNSNYQNSNYQGVNSTRGPSPNNNYQSQNFGTLSPLHPTLNNNLGPVQKKIILTEGGKPLNYDMNENSKLIQQDNVEFVPTIGSKIRYKHSNIDLDIK